MYRISLLFILLGFASCGKDESALVVNEIIYGDEVFPTTHGLIIDNGPIEDSHYNYKFYISDGKISVNSERNFDVDPSVTYILYASFASQGDAHFTTGEFIFSTSPQLTDRNIFISPSISVESPNGSFPIPGTAGSIIVSGSAPNYIITYDLIFFDKTLTGSFSGEFEIQEGPI